MGVNFQSSKEIFDALEDVDQEFLTGFDVLGRLITTNVTICRTSR